LLEIIHFFTVGKDEVRAWATRKNDSAVEAASQIHSDFSKGFISAEVIASDKLIANPKLMDKFEKSLKK
jgi:ribosome-binding ATPase YchF (GTP1/OBG family)